MKHFREACKAIVATLAAILTVASANAGRWRS